MRASGSALAGERAPVVRVSGLGKRYGAAWAVQDVSFEAGAGEVFGIIGPNGAGKTTTIKVLAGLVSPTEGAVSVAGFRVDDPRLKARIGYLPEESPLYEDMTPVAYLRFFGDLYGVPRGVAAERIERALSDLRLDVRGETRNGDLSKGMRRKVAIARALVNDPDVLLFDEPASGLDPVVSAYVLDLVRSLRAAGKTVVFSAHNLYHVERVCDRVLILRRGRVAAHGTMREIRAATRGTSYVVRTNVPVEGASAGEDAWETTVDDLGRVKDVERRAVAAGGRVMDVREKDLTLEEIFLRETAA